MDSDYIVFDVQRGKFYVLLLFNTTEIPTPSSSVKELVASSGGAADFNQLNTPRLTLPSGGS